jgi:hypothetical protein
MTALDRAKRRVEAGRRMRFYQDFYGQQWVRVSGNWTRLWVSEKIHLSNHEITTLKSFMAQRRRSGLGRDASMHKLILASVLGL